MKLYRSCKLKDLTFTATGEIIVTPKQIPNHLIKPETRHVTTWFDKPIKNVYHDDVIVEAEFTPEEFGKIEYKQIIYATPSYDYEGSSEDEEIECQIDEYITSQPIKADKLYIDRDVTIEHYIHHGYLAREYKEKNKEGYDLTEEFPYMVNGYRYFVGHACGHKQDDFVDMVTNTIYDFDNYATLTIKTVDKLYGERRLVSSVKLAEIIPFEYIEDVEIFDIDDVSEEVK